MSTGVEIDADTVEVGAQPHIAALCSGRYGAITTYLPGRRNPGVRIRPEDITIVSSVVTRSAVLGAERHRKGEPMNATPLGLVSGIALGLAAAFGGVGAFLLVLVLGALGLAAGLVADGRLDLTQVTSRDRG